jgi:hypothetical protein
MFNLVLGTSAVNTNEPCFSYSEINSHNKRYQVIKVIRDDKITEFRHCMGLLKDQITKDEFRILGGVKTPNGKIYIEHSVGELIDMANQLRMKRPFDKRELVGTNKIRE